MGVSVLLLALLPVAALSAAIVQEQLPVDCDCVFRNGSTHSGVYTIYPSEFNRAVEVYCHMDCEDAQNRGGWTVFQRRLDGSVNFYRPWDQYKKGFGNMSGEHWLGLENIFAITWQKRFRLRVEMEDFEGGNVHAEYDAFSIGPESDGYRLNLGTYIDGGARDALRNSRNRKFSTFDKDQTNNYYYYYSQNLAEQYYGGFWFGSYAAANPNGVYMWGQNRNYRKGVTWDYWKGSSYSLKSFIMMIRPISLEDIIN